MAQLYAGVFVYLFAFAMQGQPCAPQVNLGGTVAFCQGNTLVLDAGNPNANHLWSTGATTQQISVTTGGTYWVKVTNNCASVSDTVQVIVESPALPNLGPNRPLCEGQIVLRANSPGATYQWSDGSSADSLVVRQAGGYWLAQTNNCGTFYDSVQIGSAQYLRFSLGADTSICSNDYTLRIPNAVTGTFNWSNNATGRRTIVRNSGWYWAEVNNACGNFRDSIYLQFGQNLNTGFPDTLYFCPGATASLTSPLIGQHRWSTGSTTATATFSSAGVYTYTLTHACGVYRDTVTVLVQNGTGLSLGPDSTFCNNMILSSNITGRSYRWNTGARSSSIYVNKSGLYWLQVNTACGNFRDSVQLTLRRSPFFPDGDTVGICKDSTAWLDAGTWGPNTSYLWDDGSQNRFRQISDTGTYSVTIGNTCDTVFETLYAEYDYPFQKRLRDTSVCQNSNYHLYMPPLDATDSAYWDNGSVQDSIPIGQTGYYILNLINACDTVRDSAYVQVTFPPQGFSSGGFSVCADSSRLIGPLPVANTQYLWSTGDTTDSIRISQPGTYWLRATNICGSRTDTIKIFRDSLIDLQLGADRVLCQPDTAFVFLPYRMGRQFFVNGQKLQDPFFATTTSGTFIVRGENHCGSVTDTLRIDFHPAPREVLFNTTICRGGSLTLDASQNPAVNFQWSTGATSSSIVVQQGGWYWVDLSTPCRSIRDSVLVTVVDSLAPFNLGNDTIFCEGTLLLQAPVVANTQYRWQNSWSGTSFLVTQSGTYYLRMQNACNTVTDTIEVLITGPPRAVLGTTVDYCATNQFFLNAQNPGSSYQWNTGDTTQMLLVTQPGKYWVHIQNDCGQIRDTVTVIPQFPLSLNLGPDTTICQGTSMRFDPRTEGAQCLWQDGSTDSTFLATQSGWIWLQATNLCGVYTDSVFLEVIEVPRFDIPDSAICYQGGQVDLRGPGGMRSYLWSTGDTSQQVRFTQPGLYWLQVQNRCFSYTDTFELREEFPIEVGLPADTVLCERDELVLDLNRLDRTPVWENGLVSKVRRITKAGLYWLAVDNSCGRFYDSIRVDFEPQLRDTVQDLLLCFEDSLTIDLRTQDYNLRWSDGSSDSLKVIRDSGQYVVSLTNLCGTAEYTYVVQERDCDCPMFMASAFTPGGDGLNEYFTPVHSCALVDYELSIFDRWGKLLFQTRSDQPGWDGRYQGTILPSGVYLYKLRYRFNNGMGIESKTRHGHFTLLR